VKKTANAGGTAGKILSLGNSRAGERTTLEGSGIGFSIGGRGKGLAQKNLNANRDKPLLGSPGTKGGRTWGTVMEKREEIESSGGGDDKYS